MMAYKSQLKAFSCSFIDACIIVQIFNDPLHCAFVKAFKENFDCVVCEKISINDATCGYGMLFTKKYSKGSFKYYQLVVVVKYFITAIVS